MSLSKVDPVVMTKGSHSSLDCIAISWNWQQELMGRWEEGRSLKERGAPAKDVLTRRKEETTWPAPRGGKLASVER